MANLLDYISWRGDVPFSGAPFNEVDGLILSRLSYLFLDGIAPKAFSGAVPLPAAQAQYGAGTGRRILLPEDPALLREMAACRRFRGLRICGCRSRFEKKSETQFAALACLLEDGGAFLSFRGTDATLVGWKEDFNMAFMTAVPAQQDAAAYLAEAAGALSGRLSLGGHSKGGNLAIYAAANAAPGVQGRIDAIYNNDGPGFERQVLQSSGYLAVQEKIRSFVPQSSVVGMLLEHDGDYAIIHSTQAGLQQHNPYSWEVLGPRFLRVDSATESSQFVNRTLKAWLSSLSPQDRARFVDGLFEILSATDAKTLPELSDKWFKNAYVMLKTFKNVDEPTRKVLSVALSKLLAAAGESLRARETPASAQGTEKRDEGEV